MSLIKRDRSAWPMEMMWSEDRVERAFRDMFHNFWSGEGIMDRLLERSGAHLMKVEEFVEDGTCVIRAELPGIDPDRDVEIGVTADGILHLRAERQERSDDDRPDGYRSEFSYGLLERSLRLPPGTTSDDVTAAYKDGILEVRVPAPKSEEKPASKIPIAHD